MYRLPVLLIFSLGFWMWQPVGGDMGVKHKVLSEEQLELVAGTMSPKDCKKLFRRLVKSSGSILSQEAYLKQMHTHPTCVDMLNHWRIIEGDDATSHVLTKQLRQLGHDNLADRLSMSVYEAHVQNLATQFLFEERSSSEIVSILAQEAPRYHRRHLIDESEGTIIGFSALKVLLFSVITCVISASFCISFLMIVPMLCPGAKRYMSHHFRDFGLM